LQTNALRCSYEKYALQLKYHGITSTLVSLHSHEPDTSDYLTSTKGSWLRTIQGIKNLIGLKIKVRIAHVLNTKNYQHLVQFVEFVKSDLQGITEIDILLNQNRGMAINYPHLLPKLKEIRPYLFEAMKLATEQGIQLFNAYTIPHCYWKDMPTNNEYNILLNRESNQELIHSLSNNKVKSSRCSQCIHNNNCLGVWKGYSNAHGLDELEPQND